ncbi:unnamed protein product [Allacma fusca]|uniref:Peptidase S1 domain-containing protein n=1 Tax=Allacma fusca TaxID=39272 RepID=A0A8J2PV18_9HEXA|nr:unnamed protein product [Allacma fusca]
MGYLAYFLQLFIALNVLCQIFAEDETTTEALVKAIEGSEDSMSQSEYTDPQSTGTQSDNNNILLDVGSDYLYIGAEHEGLFSPLVSKDCRCGMSNNPHRIINGETSAIGAWPWMAVIALLIPDPSDPGRTIYKGFCGGSVINDRYILTAAHCAEYMKIFGLNTFRIILGDNLIDGTSSTRQVISVAQVKIHPKYNNETVNYDVALVRLVKTITYNDNIQPICLGQAGSPFPNKNVTVAGWGLTVAGISSSASNALKDTTIQVLSNAECVRIFNDPTFNPGAMICTFTKATNACNGDSGGPLMFRRVSSKIYKQIGIVSYGIDACKQIYPVVYTRVKRVLSWIRFVTRDGIYCGNSFTP